MSGLRERMMGALVSYGADPDEVEGIVAGLLINIALDPAASTVEAHRDGCSCHDVPRELSSCTCFGPGAPADTTLRFRAELAHILLRHGGSQQMETAIIRLYREMLRAHDAQVEAAAWEAGVRQAITWLRADYPYGTGPDWRENGCDWIANRLAEQDTPDQANT